MITTKDVCIAFADREWWRDTAENILMHRFKVPRLLAELAIEKAADEGCLKPYKRAAGGYVLTDKGRATYRTGPEKHWSDDL